MQLTNEIMYQASVDKNPDFEGVFWMGVKTTGIFCRPTCRARKPKAENVEFFHSTHEALTNGYRPCKVCKPLENPDETPAGISGILQELANDPSVKITDRDLAARGMEPVAVRRWFTKHHGMTFQAFQRMHRLNSAVKKLKLGHSVLDTAYDSGFESLSGFGDGFSKIFGTSPANGKYQKVIDLKRIETPVGTMYAAAVEAGICMLEFGDRSTLESTLTKIATALNGRVVPGNNPHFDLLERELAEYFNCRRKVFTVPLSPIGTDFQKKVWEVLRKIPYGETWTYSRQAEFLGDVKKVRAVANANGMNRISIVIPCHRVIGSNGTLTGYGGGIWRKQKLLELERNVLKNSAD
ncbi:methylated-DNA--[protein]-cysteine S-methyltransferase [Kaistella sp. PBT33-4]|uniref:bifunctional transcriptional activator/DNA repair enzyme AdaA n=1 Tax=Kaistella sp. PBT33-4 TaxID=3032000 RepID=UPI0031F2FE1C